MTNIFNTYLYKPLFAVLVFIYENLAFGDLGVAIIFLTVFIRLILFPLFYKGAKDQALMERLQPHIKQIQLDHKNNKERQAKLLMELYRKNRLNPFSGFFLLLLQLPVLIALYQIFIKEITVGIFQNLTFLGLINLDEKNLFLAVLAAALQYFQSKLAMAPRKKDPVRSELGSFAQMGKMMMVIGPVITFVILINFPAALGLYWATSTLFSLGQQVIINKKLPKIDHGNPDSKSGDVS